MNIIYEKQRNFVEKTVKLILECVKIDNYNYNISDLISFINDIGCKVNFNCKQNNYNKDIISLKMKKIKNKNDLKKLFKYLWRFIIDKIEIEPHELIEDYFVYALLLPEEMFLDCIFKNIENEQCNIYKVAEIFNVEYADIITRGNYLKIWDKSNKN